jgi:ectoine hydroxylase-related dioxygenase (phytanoyl-CoA dioxygenase family)
MLDVVSKMNYKIVEEILFGQGYVLIPHLLNEDDVSICNKKIENLLISDSADVSPHKAHGRRRIFNLVYEGEIFEKILTHPKIFDFVRKIFSSDFIVSDFSAHLLMPGSSGQTVHVDYPYWMMNSPYPSFPVMSVQVVWLMSNFTLSNGATRYAPGTQKLCKEPDKNYFLETAEPIIGNAGDVIIAHGLCWHDTLPNQTDRTRTALLVNYTPKFIRSSIDIVSKKKSNLLEYASSDLLSLLGIDV